MLWSQRDHRASCEPSKKAPALSTWVKKSPTIRAALLDWLTPLPTQPEHRQRGQSSTDAEERDRAWRMCLLAVMDQLHVRSLRGIGGRVWRYRRAAGDDDLPRPWPGYWSRLSDDEILDLWDALATTARKKRKGTVGAQRPETDL